MRIEEREIAGVFSIIPHVLEDERGGFFRTYCKNELAKITDSEFVQMNHSINLKKGTLRGLHFQTPPHSEDKIVRCIRGAVYDVFVDVRKDSPTFLQWGSRLLSAENKELLFLPRGIAHGFITLEDQTELLYQHSNFYTPNSEGALRYNDPILSITWPIEPIVISERDKNHPLLTPDFKGI